MNKKYIRLIVLGFALAVAGILFQNLTPVELDEVLQSALTEQQDTEQIIIRQPASASGPVIVDNNSTLHSGTSQDEVSE